MISHIVRHLHHVRPHERPVFLFFQIPMNKPLRETSGRSWLLMMYVLATAIKNEHPLRFSCCSTQLDRSGCEAAEVAPFSTGLPSLLSSYLSLSLRVSFLALFNPFILSFLLFQFSVNKKFGKTSEQSFLLLMRLLPTRIN